MHSRYPLLRHARPDLLRSVLVATFGISLVAASAVLAQTPQPVPTLLPAHELFVGTCYQPVDRTHDQIVSDVRLMKSAGFRMVRIGDLSWDAFEPREGVFDFTLYDFVMDQFQQAGIRVVLDIGGLPAPTWLHHNHPEVDIIDAHGARLHPAERYMDDLSDPVYRQAVHVFASALIRHYAHHPALAAFGYDNEVGNSYMSYSEGDRQRFITWLKQRYGTLDALNQAWSAQRWSRRIGTWDEVELPYADGPGPPERFLDLHRFWSDQTIAALEDLEAIRRQYAPQVPSASNLWDTAERKGFDYLGSYKNYVTYGAEGFYPGTALDTVVGELLTKGDLATPTWFNEFVTGGSGSYGSAKGMDRMWAYLGLLHYGQTYLAWTFNTHLGGEEQALFGLLDHDGTPSWKYDEFARIAREFAQLEKLGFPRYHTPVVAIAYSFDSYVASQYPGGSNNSTARYLSIPYREQIDGAFAPFFRDNVDAAFVNIGDAALSGYKLVVVPGDYIMDSRSSAALRDYVQKGGTVIMTAFSAKADEQSRWFGSPLPGTLSDVFGLRTAQFYRPVTPPSYTYQGTAAQAKHLFYEVLEPHTARVIARLDDVPDSPPAITENSFGRGHAFYLALPAEGATLEPLVRSLYAKLGMQPGPATPDGVYARTVENRTLYVNTTSAPVSIPLTADKLGILTGKRYHGALTLAPYDVDLLQ